jgi:hypothetical protein
MKTTKFFSALGLAILLTGLTAAFASTPVSNDNLQSSPGPKQKVTYVVTIDNSASLAGYNCNYYIVITDDRGQIVAPAQHFRVGLWNYNFTETTSTSISGNRTAHMERDPHSVCPGAYVFPASVLTGPFDPGRSYNFILSPKKGQ